MTNLCPFDRNVQDANFTFINWDKSRLLQYWKYICIQRYAKLPHTCTISLPPPPHANKNMTNNGGIRASVNKYRSLLHSDSLIENSILRIYAFYRKKSCCVIRGSFFFFISLFSYYPYRWMDGCFIVFNQILYGVYQLNWKAYLVSNWKKKNNTHKRRNEDVIGYENK